MAEVSPPRSEFAVHLLPLPGKNIFAHNTVLATLIRKSASVARMATRQKVPFSILAVWKDQAEVPREARGLSNPEIAGNEKYYHHNTDEIENIVHIVSPFFRLIGFR